MAKAPANVMMWEAFMTSAFSNALHFLIYSIKDYGKYKSDTSFCYTIDVLL